ncbi:class I SAM-dependent methyltransferase [Saccharothrix algeriensis]|uniref:SAM-dependent methyltransferase n=1 Tax=Saccharothrix algeriensis TaxID=173560 RepID=A0ABS2S004_9PSEU|nr:class I SAM-dependent methyltransferase [Saccharothrix algeriensis]MBM7809559.1 SAM-dependent methyltransferase [Saccharothrix algeriensis]
MPTVEPEPTPATGTHHLREVAESFGADAERYDRARPRYPRALVDRVVAAAPGPAAPGSAAPGPGAPGPAVLDVGCGTGIVARQFRAAGCAVLGVEPDARMAAVARRDGVVVEEAVFEGWEPAGRRFDAVVAGQAWHWVDPVAGAAKAARVLRPGGLLAVFWHVPEPPAQVGAAFLAACRRVAPELPLGAGAAPRSALSVYEPMFAKAADGIRAAGGFGEPERWRFDRERHCTRDSWLAQLPTSGVLTRLPADEVARVVDEVGAAFAVLEGGSTMPCATVAVVAARTGTT